MEDQTASLPLSGRVKPLKDNAINKEQSVSVTATLPVPRPTLVRSPYDWPSQALSTGEGITPALAQPGSRLAGLTEQVVYLSPW